MRPNNQNRRGRGRGPRKPHGGPHHGGGGGQPSKAHSFDSSGPDIRVRGNAYQVLEKYLQLARDAGTAGDRVAAENFLQHADHYYRVVAAQSEGQRPRIGGREVSVADINVNNGQGLSAAMSGHGHSGGDEQQHAAENQQGGHGNGQIRPNQNSGDAHNQHQNQNPQGQRADESQNANGEDSEANDDAGNTAPDEQPEYPEELLPADGANAAPRDGQQPQEGRHGRGRGRRRGPGRRVRSEGEEGAPAPATQPVPGETQ
jgi:hypothetical protein